jgi:hypothetical protein
VFCWSNRNSSDRVDQRVRGRSVRTWWSNGKHCWTGPMQRCSGYRPARTSARAVDAQFRSANAGSIGAPSRRNLPKPLVEVCVHLQRADSTFSRGDRDCSACFQARRSCRDRHALSVETGYLPTRRYMPRTKSAVRLSTGLRSRRSVRRTQHSAASNRRLARQRTAAQRREVPGKWRYRKVTPS